ncbi:MAG TPA: DUF433 domain-containing protein [Gemmataceae bacterium]|nr:DUF433 domain-containing protein [Gemmataceae bacterium]
MTATMSYPHIEKPEGQAAHLQRLPRVRIAQIVMDHFAHGWSVEEMCRQHPYLRPGEVHAAMGYYFDHQNEMEEEIRAEWQQVQAQKDAAGRSPAFSRLRSQGLV